MIHLRTRSHGVARVGTGFDHAGAMPDVKRTAVLTKRGFILEGITLSWNVVGVVVLGIAAIGAHSIALVAFGLDSLIEIGASTVVIWELSGSSAQRQRQGLRLIGIAFVALCVYLLAQTLWVLIHNIHSQPSALGLAWTATTALVMFGLAAGKALTGDELGNPVLEKEAKVTFIDGLLAVAVTIGLVFTHHQLRFTIQHWWWEAIAALVLCVYAGIEGVASIRAAKQM